MSFFYSIFAQTFRTMIEVKDIHKSFGSLQVLQGVSLNIRRGEIVAIIGKSGAGKTTLLQIIGTLDQPDSGSVTIDGTDVLHLGEKELAEFRNKHIGFIFQFHQLLPEFTALENVLMPALIHKDDEQRAKGEPFKTLGWDCDRGYWVKLFDLVSEEVDRRELEHWAIKRENDEPDVTKQGD